MSGTVTKEAQEAMNEIEKFENAGQEAGQEIPKAENNIPKSPQKKSGQEKGNGQKKPEGKKQAQKPEEKTGTKQKAGEKKTNQKKGGVLNKEEAVNELMRKQTERQMQKEFQKRSGVIEKNLASIENSFLTIAFNLQWIKRNEMHKKAGFKNIYDYAECVHGIGRTSCSNLICIIENFAERDENGEVLEKIAECYKKFKQSQLVAMMGMTPEQIAKIDENTSVRAINQMRKDAEILQEGEKEEDGEKTGDTNGGKEAGEKKPETAKKFVNTLIQFDSYNKYQKEIEEMDVLIERAFKKSTTPVTIKIVCEQG